jgi:excisionase family DNA binding protein
MEHTKLINAATLADHLGVDIRTVWRWVRERKIPVIRQGTRCVRFDLEKVITTLEIPATTE